MEHDNFANAGGDGQEARRPRTLTVLTLLALAAFVFSYLGAYALAGVLVTTDLMSPWPMDQDPRPRNMMVGFCALMGLFTLCAGAAKVLSAWQLRRIDAMAAEDGAGAGNWRG